MYQAHIPQTYCTSQIKFGHTFSFNDLSLFVLFDIKTMKKHIWNYVVNKKENQNMFYILDPSKWPPFALMTALYSLGILSPQSASWGIQMEWFSNNLEEVPRGAEHLLAAFPSLYGPTHPIPISIWFRSDDCGGQVIWHSTPSLSFLVK